jgi:two-component system response regulator AtoC
MKKILIVEDERNLRQSIAELLEAESFAGVQAADGREALEILREESGGADFDAVLLDLKMPRLDGLELLKILREEKLTNAPIIVLSAFGDSSRMIEAMRLGAFDYVTKPLDANEFLQIINRAATQENAALPNSKRAETTNAAEGEIIGTSRAMREIFKQIGKLAATNATVLITGESGTGKELVARQIHRFSARSQKTFVAVNCAALPENLIESELFGHERGAFTGADKQKKGRFEIADGGTLFLDEIGELPPSAQVKLLRALQERRFERVGGVETINVDVRLLAATNRDLRREIENKNFREDLFYRLAVVELRLPALRERLSDVPALAEYFLEKATTKNNLPDKFLSEATVRRLLSYDFPGNVRELENIIERAAVVANSDFISPENLFPHEPPAASKNADQLYNLPFHEAVAALERELIVRALRAADGNRTEAAKLLKINRRLLYSKIEEHRIENF